LIVVGWWHRCMPHPSDDVEEPQNEPVQEVEVLGVRSVEEAF
jgi:hypothetical protein